MNFRLVLILIVSLGVISCKSESKEREKEITAEKKEIVIEIRSAGTDIQMSDTIPSGWNTYRYENNSPFTHFLIIEKYPEGKTMKDVQELVIPHFDAGMKLINEGKPEEGFAAFGNLPEWFAEVKQIGGIALLSPGQTGETSMRLDPGNYFIECYVKMNGVFHASMGMFRSFVVSESDSGNSEKQADYAIEISSTEGIVFDKNIKSGKRQFSVYFKDQIVHENFAGHDVNLARIDDTADLSSIEKWMNWADPEGLIDPAPQGITFLGGANNMLEGEKAYFKVNLEPGNYIFISEVPMR